MAFTGNSLSERMSRWQVLVSNLKEEQAALPHVTEDLVQLEALLPEVRALQDRYEASRAQAREANAELVRLAREGDRIRGRLGATLRGRFGFDSETLIRYGYKPNRSRRRSQQATPEPLPAVAQKSEGPSS